PVFIISVVRMRGHDWIDRSRQRFCRPRGLRLPDFLEIQGIELMGLYLMDVKRDLLVLDELEKPLFRRQDYSPALLRDTYEESPIVVPEEIHGTHLIPENHGIGRRPLQILYYVVDLTTILESLVELLEEEEGIGLV